MRYRPEIDGLRALPLVPVILCNAGFARFCGGSVGVAVFSILGHFARVAFARAPVAAPART